MGSEFMKNRYLTVTEDTILKLLANALFGTTHKIPQDVDWIKIYEEAGAQKVMNLVFQNVEIDSMPEMVRKTWMKNFNLILAHNIRVSHGHVLIHELLEKNNISYVFLKGTISASYYPEPAMRFMGDVDFLIHKEDLAKTELLLKENGLKRCPGINANHICYEKGQVYELHWNVSGVPEGEKGEAVRRYLADMIECAELVRTEEGSYKAANKFHHGLVMLVHMANHMISEGIGLRHLCDWAVFVEQMSDREFCELYKNALLEIGLWRYAQLITQLSVKYLGVEEKKWAMEKVDDELLEAMIIDIFEGGNFGKKDKGRRNEAKLITNRTKGTVDGKNVFCQMVASINDIVRLHFPLAVRYKIFMPFGWIYVCGRHLIRIVLGKRPSIKLRQVTKNAQRRRKIYQKMNLYMQER